MSGATVVAISADLKKLKETKDYKKKTQESQAAAAANKSRIIGWRDSRVQPTELDVRRRKGSTNMSKIKTERTSSNETKHTPTPAFGTQKSHASRIATFKRRKPPLELDRRLVLEPAEPHGIVKSPGSRGNNPLIPPYKMPGGKKKRKSRRKSKKRHSRKQKKRSLKPKRRSRKHKRHSRKHKRHSRKHKR